jgi:branched-chain amino acid transport system substrate-binding protein
MKGFLKILAVAVLTVMVLVGTLAAQNLRIVCVVTALTGSVAQNGEYITRGINMAVDEINAKGGVGGRKLEVIFLDDQAKASEAINAVKKAIYDLNTPVILGSDWSGLVLASMQIAADEGIPQLVTATNVRITSQGIPTIFRLRANDSVAAEILAKYVNDQGYRKIGIMFTNEDYGRGFADETKDYLAKLGNQPAVIESCNLGDSDFTAQILSFKNSGVDTILALGKEIELAKFLRQTRELGVDTPVFGGSPMGLDYVVELAGGAMEGVRIVTHFLPTDPDPRIQDWVQRYEALYDDQEPTTHALAYYDATHLVAKVMEEYGTSPKDIARGLKEVNYQGIQSWFKGTPSGDLVNKQVIGEFKDGKWNVVAVLGD